MGCSTSSAARDTDMYIDVSLQPRCRNAKVCKRFASASNKRSLCTICDAFLGPLKIAAKTSREDGEPAECPVCLETAYEHVMMRCGGNHFVCLSCFSLPFDPVVGDSARLSWPRPEEYGCPRFTLPSETDVTYVAPWLTDLYRQNKNRYKEWMLKEPGSYRRYLSACECVAMERSQKRHTALHAMMRCPLCRGASPWVRWESRWVETGDGVDAVWEDATSHLNREHILRGERQVELHSEIFPERRARFSRRDFGPMTRPSDDDYELVFGRMSSSIMMTQTTWVNRTPVDVINRRHHLRGFAATTSPVSREGSDSDQLAHTLERVRVSTEAQE